MWDSARGTNNKANCADSNHVPRGKHCHNTLWTDPGFLHIPIALMGHHQFPQGRRLRVDFPITVKVRMRKGGYRDDSPKQRPSTGYTVSQKSLLGQSKTCLAKGMGLHTRISIPLPSIHSPSPAAGPTAGASSVCTWGTSETDYTQSAAKCASKPTDRPEQLCPALLSNLWGSMEQ